MTQLVLPYTIDAGTEITAIEHQTNYTTIRDLINGNLEGGSGVAGNIKANGITAREVDDTVMLRGLPGPDMQEGVVGAGDLAVTPGAGLGLNFAAGSTYIVDDSNLVATNALIPVTVSGGSVTILANASGNPRIDQVILTMTGYNTGSVSVLQGTASAGATLDNRTGAAALPAGAIRLADVLMANGFAGPFVVGTSLRDRRPWARGAFAQYFGSGTLTPGSSFTDISGGIRRVELSGVPVRISIFSQVQNNAAQTFSGLAGLRVLFDGVVTFGDALAPLDTRQATGTQFSSVFTPTAGSHVFKAQAIANPGSGNIYSSSGFVIDELIRPVVDNGTV